ncbi:MAG: pantetheine-phosphate adenylyltransferase [Candidatus Lambdaproteobacteria bacterium]|nr:pantetheine-phosphate adenylyltransferase [Candidatus Lambdaproteobacteria bacterium]
MTSPLHVLYPISGNPPTWGHADVLERAARIFGKVTWALAVNPNKTYLFSEADRLAMMQMYVSHYGLSNVTLGTYQGATVRFAERIGAQLILKGLRNATDLQAEMEQAMGNRGMNATIDTISMFTSPRYSMINSSLIRELALLGERIDDYVHPAVAARVQEVLSRGGAASS